MHQIDSAASKAPWKGKWGVPHGNNEGNLPGVPGAGGYKEYYVEPLPGATNSGLKRVVVSDADGSAYYTWTHYGDQGEPAFVQIR
jgi:guanyl-specific ribonuclease Sa